MRTEDQLAVSPKLRRLIAGVTAAAMVAGGLPSPLLAASSTPSATEFDYSACRVDDEEAFRGEVEKITMDALKRGLAGVDYPAMVGTQWRLTGMERRVDEGVDKAIAAVQEETSWTELISSLASKESAQKLAMIVAERTYQSEAMKQAIEELAGAVGRDLADRMELATLDAAVPAVACVRAFLGPRYGSTISLIVADDTGKAFQTTAAGTADVSATDVVLEGKGLIAGAVVLIVRRSLSNMARRLGQRVVGVVLGRLVSVIAGGIGLVLIAKDIWDYRNGVMPIIEEEMKSEETKEKIRAELATAISEQLDMHLKDIGVTASERILGVWREFKQAHTKVVELTERHGAFRQFMDTVDRDRLPRADRVVSLVLEREGEEGVLARLDNGTLDEAVKRMPDEALAIAADTRSLEEGFGWLSVAGPDIGKVLSLELHRAISPKELTAASFKTLIGLDDAFSVGRVVKLPAPERDALIALDPARVKALTHALTPDELASFAGYIRGLSRDAALRLTSAVADDAKRMRLLASERVRNAVLASRDQDAAIGMLLRSGGLLDIFNLQGDLELVSSGAISPILLWDRHPFAVVAIGLGVLFVLLTLRRLLFGRRRRQPA